MRQRSGPVAAVALAVVVAVSAVACNPSSPTPSAAQSGIVSIAPFSTGTPMSTPSPFESPSASPSTVGLPADSTFTAASPEPSVSAVSSVSSASSVAPAADHTVWLCRPGLKSNPCEGNLAITAVDASDKATSEPETPAADPPIDCFYVYPTVSRQPGTNSDLTIDPEEREVALAQAAQFSRVCRVYAPMYRQLTSAAISRPNGITLAGALTAYGDVSAAFADYLANYNRGRGVVFIGHSQGAIVLIALLKYQVDGNAELRKLLVSALLLGGNVAVPAGKLVGGDFANIPGCQSVSETGCVVAYSTFESQPPAGSLFGRPNTGFGPLSESDPNLRVLCVNPAAPGGGSGLITPIYPTRGLATLLGPAAQSTSFATPFAAYPGQYSAECRSGGGAVWLQVSPAGGATDKRPRVVATGAPGWGLHFVDVNIALGNLVELVGSEAAAFR